MPEAFKKNKIAGNYQKDRDYQDRDHPARQPLGNLPDRLGVGRRREYPSQQKDGKELDKMVHRARQKTIADRRQSKPQRHALRRFDDQYFFGFYYLLGHLSRTQLFTINYSLSTDLNRTRKMVNSYQVLIFKNFRLPTCRIISPSTAISALVSEAFSPPTFTPPCSTRRLASPFDSI